MGSRPGVGVSGAVNRSLLAVIESSRRVSETRRITHLTPLPVSLLPSSSHVHLSVPSQRFFFLLSFTFFISVGNSTAPIRATVTFYTVENRF